MLYQVGRGGVGRVVAPRLAGSAVMVSIHFAARGTQSEMSALLLSSNVKLNKYTSQKFFREAQSIEWDEFFLT